MSHEIKNIVAVELSEDELDNVAGGQFLSLGTFSSFGQKNLTVAQETFSGLGGSYTATLVNAQEVYSQSGQSLTVGN
ncbi:MAG: CTB family bacteriocin [Aulosira sp. DedQUE10]|nr:CTB family bacteriocin [Aulosira sp. DedQUE10]